MVLLRSLVYFLFLVLSVIAYGSAILIVGRFVSYRIRCGWANSWGRANLTMLRLICRLDYRIEGMEHLRGRNGIVMSKHQSAWETLALRALLPQEQAWVLKRELMSVPFFGWALSLFAPIAIDRTSGRKAVRRILEQGLEALRRGRWVIVFPEGTRVAPGERRKYGIGGALLAEHSGYPVFPVAHNAGSYWRRRDIRKYPGTISVRIGPPIDSQGRSAAQINRAVETWIETQMELLTAQQARGEGLGDGDGAMSKD